MQYLSRAFSIVNFVSLMSDILNMEITTTASMLCLPIGLNFKKLHVLFKGNYFGFLSLFFFGRWPEWLEVPCLSECFCTRS